MDIRITTDEKVSVISIEGNLDTNTSKEANDTITELIDEGGINLIFDFTKLDYISSTGLRVLLATMKRIKPLNGAMSVCGLNETVKEVFEISGFTMLIKLFNTLDEAKGELLNS